MNLTLTYRCGLAINEKENLLSNFFFGTDYINTWSVRPDKKKIFVSEKLNFQGVLSEMNAGSDRNTNPDNTNLLSIIFISIDYFFLTLLYMYVNFMIIDYV